MTDKMREAFEAEFPCHEYVAWDEGVQAYHAANDSFEAMERADKQQARWEAWQAAQRQGGEAVAWRVSHPDKTWDVYQQYPAWAEGDFTIQPLYTRPPAREQVQPQTDWFLYGERLPDEDDEDCEGSVWNFMPGRSSAPMLTTAGETRRRYETGIVVHWKPTGLERPETPEE